MFAVKIYPLLLLLVPAAAFMVFNTEEGLCLQESEGKVFLSRCDLDSEAQQWTWIDQSMLMSVLSSRCLEAGQGGNLQTRSCIGSNVDPAGLLWDCDRDRLISRSLSMFLSVRDRLPVLSPSSKQTKWRSMDRGDICGERLRSRRAADEPEEFEEEDMQMSKPKALSEKEKELLRWFYRTEDPTIWKFVLLGLAFVCLLVGFLLLGMGAMANKNRKKIAKYKAAAALAQMGEGEQLRVILAQSDDSGIKPSPLPDRLQEKNKPSPSNGELTELRAGDIVVTWKDGNTSCLYNDAVPEEEQREEPQEEKLMEQTEEQSEEQQVEVSAEEPVSKSVKEEE